MRSYFKSQIHFFFDTFFINVGFKETTTCCGSGLFKGLPSCGGKREIPKYELCDNLNEYFSLILFILQLEDTIEIHIS